MFKHYIDENQNIRAIEVDDEAQEALVQGSWVELTEEAKEAELKARVPERTIQQQIVAVERTVTQRHLRSAALGDAVAIQHIQDVEDSIAELRLLL